MNFKKSNLRDGDIVMYRSGILRTVKGEKLYNNLSQVNTLSNYDENLKSLEHDDLNIVEVYRLIWKREEPTITADEKLSCEISTLNSNISQETSKDIYMFITRNRKKVNTVGCHRIISDA